MPAGVLEKLGLGVHVQGFREFMRQTSDMTKGVDGLDTRMKDVRGAEAWGKSLTKVGGTVMGVGTAMTAALTVPILAVASSSVQAAAEAARFQNALAGLAGGADRAAQYVAAIQGASQGAINSTEAMSYAVRALTLDVVDNADEMRDLTQVAITLGRAQGLDAARAVNDLTVALGRQSPMILDNLGITMKLSEAYEKYAARIGKTESELTDMEKRQAFVTEALEKGRAVAEKLGGVTEDMATQSASLQSKMHDLRVEMGQELLPVMTDLMGMATKLVGGFGDLDEKTRRLVIRIGVLAAAAGPATTVIGGLITAGGTLLTMLPEIAFGVQALAAGFGVAEIAAVSTGAAIGGLVLPATVAVAAIAGVILVLKELSDWEKENVETADRMAVGWGNTAQAYAAGLATVGVASELSKGQMSDYAEMAEHTGLRLGMVGDKTLAMVDASKQWIVAAGETVQPTKDMAGALDEVAEAEERVVYSADKIAGLFGEMDWDDWQKHAWKMAQGLGLSVPQLADMAKELGIADDAQIKFALHAQGLSNVLADDKDHIKYMENFEDLGLRMNGTYERMEELSTMEDDLKRTHRDAERQTEDYGRAIRDTTDRADDYYFKMRDLEDAVVGLAEVEEEAIDPTWRFGHELSGSGVAQRAEEASDGVTMLLDEIIRMTDPVIPDADRKLKAHIALYDRLEIEAQTAAGAIRAVHHSIERMPDSKVVHIIVRTTYEGRYPEEQDPGPSPGVQAGTAFVPRTATYRLHRGEAVLPVPMARTFRAANYYNEYNYNLTTQSITRPGALRHEFGAMEVLSTR